MKKLLTILAGCAAAFLSSQISAQNCQPPADVRVAALTPNSAVIAFNRTTGSRVRVVLSVPKSDSPDTPVPVGEVFTALNRHTFRGLVPGRKYFYNVYSQCDTLNPDLTPDGFFIVPTVQGGACGTAPQNLSVGNITEKTASVQWAAVSGTTGYVAEYRWVNSADFIVLPPVAGTSLNLSLPEAGFTYEVRVRANCNGSASPYSASVLFQTKAPVVRCDAPRLTVTETQTRSAKVAWNLPMSDYSISFKKESESEDRYLTQILNRPAPYELTGLEANTRYIVRVQQFCGNLASDFAFVSFSTQDDFTLCPTVVYEVKDVLSDRATLVITEKEAEFGNKVFDTYEISYRKTSDLNTERWAVRIVNAPDPQPTVTPFTLPDLEENTEYEVRIRRFCTDRFSDYTPITTFTTPRVILCNAPTVDISDLKPVSASVAVAPLANLHEIWYRDIRSQEWIKDFTREMPYALSGLIPGKTYEVKARNICVNGVTSLFSASVRFIVPAFEPVCEKPVVSVQNVTEASARLVWGNQFRTAEIRLQSETDRKENVLMYDFNGMPSFSLTGLRPETHYTVWVRHLCNGLFSDFTEFLTFTTNLNPSKCYAPINLTAERLTPTTAALRWTIPPLVSRYRVEYRRAGTGSWTGFGTAAPSGTFTLTGLRPSTNYQLRMITLCPLNTASADTAEVFFTTLAGKETEPQVSENLNLPEAFMYPNPASDRLNFRLPDSDASYQVSITDLQGKTFMNLSLTGASSEINLSELPAGIYVVKAVSENSENDFSFTQKLTVVK